MDIKKLFNYKIDRRRLIGNLGMMGAGAAFTVGCGVAQDDNGTTDLDPAILNFALNLEYLEAAFYLAAIGRLTDLPNYTSGSVVLPSGYSETDSLSFVTPTVRAYAEEIALDELAHVNFLINALGADAADLPTIDLDASFKGAASAAFQGVNPADVGLPADFDPSTDFVTLSTDGSATTEAFFLHGAFIFEDVGVTAYKGAAPLITNRDTLGAAAGILAVEAYHAGEVRTFLYQADVSVNDLYGGLNTHAILGAISDARDSLDGSSDLDQGVVDGNGNANIVPTDSSAIAFSRTPSQVAQIVYLTTDLSTPGGFFPNGISIPSGLEDAFDDLFAL